MTLAWVPVAQAIDWLIEPSVRATANYTDNVNHSANNTEDSLSLSVSPGFVMRAEGSRRVEASLQYELTGVTRFGGDQNDDLYHRLNAIGNAELVEDFLFIDGTVRVSQELISLLGSTAEAEVNDANRATVGTYSISPYIQRRFGTLADAEVRYMASGSVFESDVAANATVNAITAGLTSGTRFNDLSWGLHYSLREASYHDLPDATLERAVAQLGYALSRKFRVFGTVGQDWNDYLSTTETDGSSYSVGFGWTPTRRTSVEVSAGERYFGSTYSFSGSHRTRLSQWTLSYYEDVSDFTQQFLAQSSRIFWACPSGLVETVDMTPPEAGCQGPITAGELALFYSSLGVSESELVAAGLLNISSANGIYIIKSMNAGVSWNLRRLDFGLSAHDVRRQYQLFSGAEDRTQGVTASVDYRLSPRTSAFGSLSLSRNSQDPALTGGTERDDDILSLSVGLNHNFAEDLDGSLAFHRTQRDSNVSNADYDENRLTAMVNMRF